MSRKSALILGCGYVGLALARACREAGIDVTATTRTPDRLSALRAAGVVPMVADVMNPATLRPLLEVEPDVVFDLVQPQRIDEDRYTSWGTRNVATTFAEASIEALVYLSSTAVYGTPDEDVADERTPAKPNTAIGRARLEAERVYLEFHAVQRMPVRICRVPEVYGPRRTLRDRLETGAYLRADEDDQRISRIHVDDLAAGLIAAWRRGRAGEIYLLCDDDAATGREYAELTASLLSLPLPPRIEREDIRHELSHGSFDRRLTAIRCSNGRLRRELGVELRYPTIREGIPASLRAEGAC